MPTKKMPTGEEPPKGYESLVEKPKPEGLRVKGTLVSQLAKSERAEIDSLRAKALANIDAQVRWADEILTFEDEVGIIKDRSLSDKMLFMAHKDTALAGYALVVIGWPDPGIWTIQHLIINPENRLQGVGTSIVRKIESYALSSEVASENIFAIPVERDGTNFWKFLGYTVETGRLPVHFAGLERELVICRKELSL